MPLWQVGALCALYALGVRAAEWAAGRLLLSLLVVSLGFFVALPGTLEAGPGPLLRAALALVLQMLLAVAMHLGAQSTENGGRAGLLVPLGLGLLAPQPLLLLALAGGALARPGADDRPVAWRVAPGGAAWRWGLAALALTLSALLLPRQPSLWAGWFGPAAPSAPRPSVPAPPPPPLPPPAAPTPPDSPLLEAVRGSPEIRLPFQLGGQVAALPLELFLLVGLALVAALGYLQWRLWARTGHRPTLVERLMVLGLLLTGLAWLAASLLLSGSGAGGGQQVATSAPPPPGNALRELLNRVTSERIIDVGPLFTVLLILSLLLLVGMVILALRLGQALRPAAAPDAEVPAGPERAAEPLHRVRRAWQQAEAALRATGQGRAESETPAGYAARLGRQFPALAGPLQVLSAAYGPVRYGGRITDDEADVAEAALADLRSQATDLHSADLHSAELHSADRTTPDPPDPPSPSPKGHP
ncbi:DUF4129 domain-containing protein [Deinococcus koreensis]|uniref:Protein-glutamine gamma-glutamyltransferase-like C-terminal domain-containing protein n=1 Tax=Deinococcus koreensis TaxID=2054903 RepID=A0A2K3UUW6_9DEIO|nr:DUF4129 domain-containing protein [Deinococcus koreensis]PNY80319.1 hypothetical protein CVO96_02105 [Deinococcus koreensis]